MYNKRQEYVLKTYKLNRTLINISMGIYNDFISWKKALWY